MTDRTVIVAEVGANFGSAIAIDFARHGANLVLGSALSEVALDATRDQARAVGARVVSRAWSLDRVDSIRDLTADALAEYGRIDLLLSNLGSVSPPHALLDTSLDEWDASVERVLWASLQLAQSALPTMISQTAGRMTFITVANGSHGQGASASAVHMGTVGLMRGIVREYGKFNIVANAVCVEGIADGASEFVGAIGALESHGATSGSVDEFIALGRAGSTSELVFVVRTISDEENGYVAGQSVYVNGGKWFS